MNSLYLVSYFFAGAFLANVVPHFVSGIMGRPFPTPFAKPPGKGLSSSTVNVLWGFANLVFAYLLLLRVGHFDPRSFPCIASFAAGVLLLSLQLARHFGQLHGGNTRSAHESSALQSFPRSGELQLPFVDGGRSGIEHRNLDAARGSGLDRAHTTDPP